MTLDEKIDRFKEEYSNRDGGRLLDIIEDLLVKVRHHEKAIAALLWDTTKVAPNHHSG